MVKEVASYTCDVCGITDDNDMDMQEYHRVDFIGGYKSIFGDGAHIRCDITHMFARRLSGLSILGIAIYAPDGSVVATPEQDSLFWRD